MDRWMRRCAGSQPSIRAYLLNNPTHTRQPLGAGTRFVTAVNVGVDQPAQRYVTR